MGAKRRFPGLSPKMSILSFWGVDREKGRPYKPPIADADRHCGAANGENHERAEVLPGNRIEPVVPKN
jgi:hypothetical protein